MLSHILNKMVGLHKILPHNDLNIVFFTVLIIGNNNSSGNISGNSENKC